MKIQAAGLSFFVLISLNASAQEQNEMKSKTKPAPKTMVVKVDQKQKLTTENNTKQGQNLNSTQSVIEEVKSEPAPPTQVEMNSPTIESTTALIHALESKKQWVMSNKKEHKKAKKSGWYEQTDLEIRKQKEILKQLQSK